MSLKETNHFRRKAALFEDVQREWMPHDESTWAAQHYIADVLELCDQIEEKGKRIDQLQEVADAARALISSPNGEEHSWVQVDEWRRLEAALRALQTEKGES